MFGVWVIFAVGGTMCVAQNGNSSAHAAVVKAEFIPASGEDPSQDMLREMARRVSLERQGRMKADSEKLLRLAAELKDSVEKSNGNILSVEIVKKAQEIEKLAHSVKEKMKGQ
jgi:hypothetical protein